MAEKDLYFCDPNFTEPEEPTKDMNKPESLLSLYIPKILEAFHTSKKSPMSQQKLLAILQEYPYELDINRRTLSRTLNTIVFYAPAGVHMNNEGKVWYDCHDDYWLKNRPGAWGEAA